jgi:hypothetical protein
VTAAIDNIDAALDAALGMTFPASDPVALSMPYAGDPPVGDDQAAPGYKRDGILPITPNASLGGRP